MVVRALLLAALLTVLPILPLEGADAPDDTVRLIVSFEGGLPADLPEAVVLENEALGFVVVEAPASEAAATIQQLAKQQPVAHVEPDAAGYSHAIPGDMEYSAQWGPQAIGAEAAWDITAGSSAVTLAVLDTGIDPGHMDLDANKCSVNSQVGGTSPDDDTGHGTHVAGIAAAETTFGAIGPDIAGMAQVCIMSVKVLHNDQGYASDIAAGITWATDNDADIINLSLGSCQDVAVVQAAVEYAWDEGVLLVASAGNEDPVDGDYQYAEEDIWACDGSVTWPAAYPEVIAVGALDYPGDMKAPYSLTGPELELAAPGSEVLSTWPGYIQCPTAIAATTTCMLSGTSMAAPHVSGTAALLLSADPSLTNEAMRCILALTADDVEDAGRDEATGWGRVNAAAAMDHLSTTTHTLGLCPVALALQPTFGNPFP